MIGAARVVALALAGVVAAGILGAWRYVAQYDAYRGFGPPVDTAPPDQRGTIAQLTLHSAALGGRPVTVTVYLPAAYRREPARRFPSIYLLQGMPGSADGAYLNSMHLVPLLDQGIASGRLRPLIAVIPPGVFQSRSVETEWADARRPDQHWFTFLTRDVVHAVDARFRTVATPAARGIGGYSAGADGALDALFLRPGLFGVALSLSGDFRQDPTLVGNDAALVRRFSPILVAPAVAARLAAEHAHVRLVVGATDRTARVNRDLAHILERAHVDVQLRVVSHVGHSWKLWQRSFPGVLGYFSDHLAAS